MQRNVKRFHHLKARPEWPRYGISSHDLGPVRRGHRGRYPRIRCKCAWWNSSYFSAKLSERRLGERGNAACVLTPRESQGPDVPWMRGHTHTHTRVRQNSCSGAGLEGGQNRIHCRIMVWRQHAACRYSGGPRAAFPKSPTTFPAHCRPWNDCGINLF